ncbi:hypothetical protein [Pelosinus fermentans]|uniref:hypothetical protein n=1 Tax=Pelosinus fermentans TaxID=365349 RepID=UPI00059119F7|nr:hypothetical protein [Pelosinus fermentans]
METLSSEYYIAAMEVVTPYGYGMQPLFEGVFSGIPCFRTLTSQEQTDLFGLKVAGVIELVTRDKINQYGNKSLQD